MFNQTEVRLALKVFRQQDVEKLQYKEPRRDGGKKMTKDKEIAAIMSWLIENNMIVRISIKGAVVFEEGQ